MNGVLHYIQHEWSRHELERAQWEMERAELKVKFILVYYLNIKIKLFVILGENKLFGW